MGDFCAPGQGVPGGICRSAGETGRRSTIGVAGRRARVRAAEGGDQGGEPFELIALRAEIEGAEADDDVPRSGRDVAAQARCDALGGCR